MPRHSGKRANGEGTVYLRKDGRWEAALMVPTPTGALVRRRVYGKTRQEAHEKLTALARLVHQGMPVASASHTVEAYLRAWLHEVAKRRVRPRTWETYELLIRRHIVPVIGDKRLDRLTAADVRRLLDRKRDEELSTSTVRQLHAVLRVALQQAVREDLLPRNIARLVEVPVPSNDPVWPLTMDEARRLLKTASEDRLYALWAVAVGVGLRRGEALGLRWEDVDLEDGTVRVAQSLQRAQGRLQFSAPKTARSRRTVPLPHVCVEALRGHRHRQDGERQRLGEAWTESGLVFTTAVGTPIEPRNLNRSFDALCARADVRRVRLHDLRHTCASLLLAQGVSPRVVMETLGHSQISITMNTYTHVMPAVQREAAARMHQALDSDVAANEEGDPTS